MGTPTANKPINALSSKTQQASGKSSSDSLDRGILSRALVVLLGVSVLGSLAMALANPGWVQQFLLWG